MGCSWLLTVVRGKSKSARACVRGDRLRIVSAFDAEAALSLLASLLSPRRAFVLYCRRPLATLVNHRRVPSCNQKHEDTWVVSAVVQRYSLPVDCPVSKAKTHRDPQPIDFDGEVNLFHFVLLRSVGKGAFGKVSNPQFPHPSARPTFLAPGPSSAAQADTGTVCPQVHK